MKDNAKPNDGPRRGLRREDAAVYVGVSARQFVEWVSKGLMPKPKRVEGVVVWDRKRLDIFFEALPEDETAKTVPNTKWHA